MDVQFQMHFQTNRKENHLCSVRKDFDELGKGDLADFQPFACRVVNDRIPIFRRICRPLVISSEPILHPGVFPDVESGLIERDERQGNEEDETHHITVELNRSHQPDNELDRRSNPPPLHNVSRPILPQGRI